VHLFVSEQYMKSMQTSLAYWYYLTQVSTECILRRAKISFTVEFSFTIFHGREHPRNLGTGRTEHTCEVRNFNSKAVTIHPLPENKPDLLPHTLDFIPPDGNGSRIERGCVAGYSVCAQ